MYCCMSVKKHFVWSTESPTSNNFINEVKRAFSIYSAISNSITTIYIYTWKLSHALARYAVAAKNLSKEFPFSPGILVG